MRALNSFKTGRARHGAGFTMVELSVALVIALFLLAGLFTIEQSTRKTSTQQTALAQLQDSERLAMTIMTDVIQGAGFFARPTAYTAATALPSAAAPTLFAAGQGLYGSTVAGTDSIYVQFMSEGPTNDNMILCNGQQTPNTPPNPGIAYINEFSVDTVKQQLLCTVSTNVASTVTQLTTPPVVLVEGVQNLQVLYGVATTGTNGNSVDTYMTAAQVQASASGWGAVSSVKVTLTFTNPLYQPAGQPAPTPGQQPTVTFERVVGIMSRADG
jgi:type IV pilus assembly protein PilW